MLLKKIKTYLRTGDPAKESEKRIECLKREREMVLCFVHK
jgi:hypothetical protein